MSTNSYILFFDSKKSPTSFEGVYHHWDGYPSGVGKKLHELYNTFFNKNVQAMKQTLVDENPAGWSNIIENWNDPKNGPVSYTMKGEPSNIIRFNSLKNLSADFGIQFIYIIDIRTKNMYIITNDDKLRGFIVSLEMAVPKKTWNNLDEDDATEYLPISTFTELNC